MHRAFEITLPADTNPHNLYSLIVGTAAYGLVNGGTNETGVTGAVPVDGILPDRVQELSIIIDTGTVTISDRNTANTEGEDYPAGASLTRRSTRNSICLKDYILIGGAGGEIVVCDFEAM